MKENHKHNDSPSESPLLDQTRKFVVELMTNKLPEQYVYHNLQHTLDVVSAAEEIAIHSNLETEQIEVVMAAAYLHDIGYIKNNEQHEDHSITLSREFLDQLGANKKYIEDVIGCIEATKLPQNNWNPGMISKQPR